MDDRARDFGFWIADFTIEFHESRAPQSNPKSAIQNPKSMQTLIFFFIFLALVFDFLNAFHDAANSIATVVSTRVLTPTAAVIWAAVFNFVAAFIFGTKVAGTISADLVDKNLIDIYVVAGGLVGAIAWNLITWWLGLPTSSSHALVGGLGGAAVV